MESLHAELGLTVLSAGWCERRGQLNPEKQGEMRLENWVIKRFPVGLALHRCLAGNLWCAMEPAPPLGLEFKGQQSCQRYFPCLPYKSCLFLKFWPPATIPSVDVSHISKEHDFFRRRKLLQVFSNGNDTTLIQPFDVRYRGEAGPFNEVWNPTLDKAATSRREGWVFCAWSLDALDPLGCRSI